MSFSSTPYSHTPAAGMADMLASADRREKAKQQQSKGSSGGLRDQTNTKSFQGSQSSFAGSKTPSTAKKTGAAGKEQADASALDDEGDFRSGALGADGEAKKKRTRPKIDADLLAGSSGLAAILKTFPSLKQELKGEGHEAHDVRLLIGRLQVPANYQLAIYNPKP
jgi:hypothetical protein